VRLHVVTALAVAVVAFYLGVAVDATRTPSEIEIPDSIPVVTTIAGPLRLHDSSVMVVAVQSHTDRLQLVAAIAAAVAGAFLLARLALVVIKLVRVRRAA
jgi:hypothetical protein